MAGAGKPLQALLLGLTTSGTCDWLGRRKATRHRQALTLMQ